MVELLTIAQTKSETITQESSWSLPLYPFFIVGFLLIAFTIYTIVDVNKYSEAAFQATGAKKSNCIVWPIVLYFICGVGSTIMCIIWFASKRAQVQQAAGGQPGAPGGQPLGGQ